jgi:Fic family protein
MQWQEIYPHLDFSRQLWDTNSLELHTLATECRVLIERLSTMPVPPEDSRRLHQLSGIKGVQATTAIEGNSLNLEEIKRVIDSSAVGVLPPSKQYQEQEVRNMHRAFNQVCQQVLQNQKTPKLNPELIQEFHRWIGQDLGEFFEASPGRWREHPVVVGRYRPPDSRYLPDLIAAFCDWLGRTFRYGHADRTLNDALIQAPVAHAVFEWIHPFGDGNGRTGRLIEFYLLLRSGVPTFAAHQLANHYNETRTEYYSYLNRSHHEKNLTPFLVYALVGLRDGLHACFDTIIESQHKIIWTNHVYQTFDQLPEPVSDKVKRRLRTLALELPPTQDWQPHDIPTATIQLALQYGGLHERTLHRDLEALVELGLLEQLPDGTYHTTRNRLLLSYEPPRFSGEPVQNM